MNDSKKTITSTDKRLEMVKAAASVVFINGLDEPTAKSVEDIAVNVGWLSTLPGAFEEIILPLLADLIENSSTGPMVSASLGGSLYIFRYVRPGGVSITINRLPSDQ